uniref:Uncharacterized protein n=1 Tax=Hemiselmis andersenii TaxID=464988 RepID=A0A6U4KX61_HEMAN|mmetsp:Transcript_25268/g.58540  ORF Transcript_25268/g.58540 Transcript_25268/m.58540 type:complete len:192 (+) Transcript_25268:75-650(+)
MVSGKTFALAALPVGLVACLLFITAMAPTSQSTAEAELVGWGGKGPIGVEVQLRRNMREVARGRAYEMHRIHRMQALTAAAAPAAGAAGGGDAEEPCVSWRGCSESYNGDTMNVTMQNYYDRFDRYPNAWDASASARWFKKAYPNGAWPAYNGEVDGVVVDGDPSGMYPQQQYGAPNGHVIEPYSPRQYWY